MISFDRVRERKLFQWAVAYLAAAWLALQVLTLVAAPFGWPNFVLRTATVLFAVGFVAAPVLAWFHGEKGRQRVSGTELLLLAGVLMLAGGGVWLVRDDPSEEARAQAAETPRATSSPDSTVAEQNSIAVLPFIDPSPNRDQEYFSDGITEELLSALAKVERLRVAARTSSFSFKGKDVPVDEIGARLRVANVLEGTVQKEGTRVRNRARLVHRFFEQAIRIDPSFARAHAGLGDALIVLPLYSDARPAEVQPRAKAAVERARSLDPSLGEAIASLAYVRMSFERDWKGAGPLFQEALSLRPNYATAHQWYGDYL
ncbi:MAG: hypothetical protein ACREMQ_04840, partial [Longimicrobiales bacterium]